MLQTLVICLLTGFITQSFWFSYILFLVFLGGLLVLFIYVTSLASNEIFSLSTKLLLCVLFPLRVGIMLCLLTDATFWTTSLLNSDIRNVFILNNYFEEAAPSLIKLYNQPTGYITLILVLYLFLTLIAVVKITSIFAGPLRQQN